MIFLIAMILVFAGAVFFHERSIRQDKQKLDNSKFKILAHAGSFRNAKNPEYFFRPTDILKG
jgi:hypothetical protein